MQSFNLHLLHLLLLLCGLIAADINFGDESSDSSSSGADNSDIGGEPSDPIPADVNNKFIDLAGVTGAFQNPLVAAGAGAVVGSLGTVAASNILNQNNCGFGRRKRRGRRQIKIPGEGGEEGTSETETASGDESKDPNNKFFGPFANNNCNNPCGRRRRRRQDEDQTNNKFFFGNNQGCGGNFNNGGFNNGGFNNGGFNNGGFNNGGLNNGGFNNGGFNNGGFNNGGLNNGGFNNGGLNNGGLNNGGFNNGGFNNNNGQFNNNGGSIGRGSCTSLTFFANGRQQGACQTPDNTGQVWCYTNGFNNGCFDLQRSSKFPNNPWSYAACRNQC